MSVRKIWNGPLLRGVAMLLALLALTQYLAYQQYQLARQRQDEQLQHELSAIKDKFQNILHNDVAAANALAILYEQYGAPANFDSVAAQISQYGKYVDGLQLQQRGIITHAYPQQGKSDIGINVFADSLRLREARYAAEKQSAWFAGPRRLRQGGTGIVAKVPVIVNGEAIAFSVVLTKMSTIQKALGLDNADKKIFAYNLVKKDSGRQDPAAYSMNGAVVCHDRDPVSVDIPEGNWVLSVAYSTAYKGRAFPTELAILGIMLSAIAAWAVYRKLREPHVLKQIIEEKTRQMSSGEKYYRTLIETSSDAIVLLDRNGHTIYQTPSTEKISGYSLADMQHIDGLELIHPDDRKKDNEEFGRLVRTAGAVMTGKHRLKRKDGKYIWIEGTYRNLLHDVNVRAIVYSYTDVTEQQTSLAEIKKYNLELTLLNTVNDIILHGEEKKPLLDAVCQCIANVGGYKLAWIGETPDNSETERIPAPVAAYGDLEFLEKKTPALWDKLAASSPARAAALTCEPVVINNVPGTDSVWCHHARLFNIGSVIVLPLRFNNSTGALSIYSETTGVFGTHELNVFKRLGENISLAVRAIQTREEKGAAAHLLNERVKELSTIYQLNRLLQNEELTVDEVFTKLVNILPAGWQYPEICAVRVEFDGRTHQTKNYRPSDDSQAGSILLQDGRRGLVEVVYLEERPQGYEGPFLKEERDLLTTICSTVEVYFNKRTHQLALTKSEANLRSVFENTEIGYLLLDANLDVVAFNQYMKVNYRKQSGIELTVGDNFLEPIAPERKTRIATLYHEAITQNRSIEYESQYINNGVANYFWVNVVPVRNNEQVTGLCLAIYEITKLKNLEQEREKIIRDLTQRNTDLEQFAQIVSHNLRGPLSIILGVNSLLEDPMPEEEKNSLIDEIRVASNKLDTVIMDLNEILQTRREIAESKEPVDLETMVKNVQDTVSTMFRDSEAVIDCDFSAAKELVTDKSYMNAIFYNLITNSIKYAKPGERPAMKIWSEQNGGSVVIYHKDNGIGIDLEKHKEKVFQLYQRFHLDVEGKGLGLFMTRTQVETLGGSITVESTPGEGCLFAMTFPS